MAKTKRTSSTPKAPAGEEWRDMDAGPATYDPSRDAGILREARRRIAEHRMRDVAVRLVDGAGRPLARRDARAILKRHAFPFGEQLWPLDAMIRDGEEHTGRARAWKQRFAEVFNAANNLCYWTERPRNDASKVEDRQGEWRVENFARTVEWTLGEGLIAKGHPLFWSIPKCVPDWVQRYDYETRMKFAEVRVRNLVARFRGKISIWDAVNEPMWEASFRNLAVRQWPHIEPVEEIVAYVAPVLRWCREEDPDATYTVNDYGMEDDTPGRTLKGSDGSRVTAASQRKRFLALLRALCDRGSPPDAVGLQSHIGWISHEKQWAIYDEFAQSGLPIHITEFWANTDELQRCGRYAKADVDALVAEYVANYLTCAFAHPAIEAFFFWGFMDAAIRWHGDRSSHETTPLFERVRRLIHEEWHTDETLQSDHDGTIRFRGFAGDYALRVRHGDGTWSGLPFRADRRCEGPIVLVVPRNKEEGRRMKDEGRRMKDE